MGIHAIMVLENYTIFLGKLDPGQFFPIFPPLYFSIAE
jgi:hypothetical protein